MPATEIAFGFERTVRQSSLAASGGPASASEHCAVQR